MQRARSEWAAAAARLGFALAPARTSVHARYLGFQLGVDGEERDLELQSRLVEDTVRWAAGLPSGTGLRVVRYPMYCHSILRYWLAIAPPTAALRRAERCWAAIIFAAPMRSVPLEGLAPVKAGGVGTVFPAVDDMHIDAAVGFLRRT